MATTFMTLNSCPKYINSCSMPMRTPVQVILVHIDLYGCFSTSMQFFSNANNLSLSCINDVTFSISHVCGVQH